MQKICMLVQIYDDGSWVLDSMEDGSINATLDSGEDLRSIVKTINYYKKLFLEAIKEQEKGGNKDVNL